MENLENNAVETVETVGEAVVADPKATLVGKIALGSAIAAAAVGVGLLVKKFIDKKKAEKAELEEPTEKVVDIPEAEVTAQGE